MSGETWQRSDNWIGSEVEDSFVMVHIDSGRYIALNATAAAIWSAIEVPRAVPDIAAALRRSFDVSESDCVAAVEQTLGEMRSLQMAAPH